MNEINPDDNEFLHQLLQALTVPLPDIVLEPDAKLKEEAWKTAQMYQKEWKTAQTYQQPADDEFEIIELIAAGSESGVACRFNSNCGRWHLVSEEIIGEDTDLFLKFKCGTDWIDYYHQRAVEIAVSGQKIWLGKIDRHGIAETRMARTVDLWQGLSVRIPKRE
jgi:hypothetical protein